MNSVMQELYLAEILGWAGMVLLGGSDCAVYLDKHFRISKSPATGSRGSSASPNKVSAMRVAVFILLGRGADERSLELLGLAASEAGKKWILRGASRKPYCLLPPAQRNLY